MHAHLVFFLFFKWHTAICFNTWGANVRLIFLIRLIAIQISDKFFCRNNSIKPFPSIHREPMIYLLGYWLAITKMSNCSFSYKQFFFPMFISRPSFTQDMLLANQWIFFTSFQIRPSLSYFFQCHQKHKHKHDKPFLRGLFLNTVEKRPIKIVFQNHIG